MITTLDYNGYDFTLVTPSWDGRSKAAPTAKWSRKLNVYLMPVTTPNIKFIEENFDATEVTDVAVAKIKKMKNEIIERPTGMPLWYKSKTFAPMKHQEAAQNKAYMMKEHALLMEMGTGKTFVAINVASARAMSGQIEALIVICPTSIKSVWKNEVKLHSPVENKVHVLVSGDKKVEAFVEEEYKGLKILVVGVEALSQGKANTYALNFTMRHKTMAVVDESSRIKNDGSARTKKCINIGAYASFRMILTGTPITQGIHDLYAQFRFLNWNIIGQKSYFGFKNRYCVMGGFERRQIVGYINIKELMGMVRPFSFVVNKKDVMDLPPKVYEQRIVEPTKDQMRVINELGLDGVAELDGRILETETVLERMTRYMQIAGGSFPFDEEDGLTGHMYLPGVNPKMKEMMEVIEDLPVNAKVIIWAKFKPEIYQIVEKLQDRYGEESIVEFHGDISEDDREIAIETFQDKESPVRFFVSNQQTGGIGITLTAATYTIYYSNTFSHEERKQSEDRPHRKGQENTVTYIDIILNHKIDKMILSALLKKANIADFVNNELRRK